MIRTMSMRLTRSSKTWGRGFAWLMLASGLASCQVESEPPPEITWESPGVEVRPSEAGNGSSDTGERLTPAEGCVAAGSPITPDHREMFNLLNDYRSQNGRDLLVYSTTLERAADDYARRLYQEGFFDHEAPDGSTPGDRALAAGFCNPYVGENLAYSLNQLPTAADALDRFAHSPGHDSTMLYPEWDYVGIGFLRISSDAGYEVWWVQLFGQDVLHAAETG
jgi:uncharacterized protein YkwD